MKIIYGMLAMGWRGSRVTATAISRPTSCLRAGNAARPSVHSEISFDFSVPSVPGWHTTIFPPYFVAGAIYSGFAIVLTCDSIAQRLMPWRLHHHRHLDTWPGHAGTGSSLPTAIFLILFLSLYSGNSLTFSWSSSASTGVCSVLLRADSFATS